MNKIRTIKKSFKRITAILNLDVKCSEIHARNRRQINLSSENIPYEEQNLSKLTGGSENIVKEPTVGTNVH